MANISHISLERNRLVCKILGNLVHTQYSMYHRPLAHGSRAAVCIIQIHNTASKMCTEFLLENKLPPSRILWHCGHLPTPLATVRPVGCTPITLYCTCTVQCIGCYVTVNKPVLSYLSLRLLPQWWPRTGCTLCTVHCTSVHSHSHVGSYTR